MAAHRSRRLLRRTGGQQPPLLEHDEVVGQRHGLLQPLLGQQDRQPQLLIELAQRVQESTRRDGVELARRLVQNEHIRPHDHDGREVEHLLLAAGKRGHTAVEPVGNAEVARHLGDAQAHGFFLAAKALEPERQLVEHLVRHDLIVRMLEHEADAPRLLGKRDVLQGRAPEAHRAADRAVRCEAGLELAQESRFAAAALAAEDGDRPLRDREREVIERRARLARIGKRQMFERKRRHVSASFPSSSSGRKHSSAKHAMHTAPSAPSPPMRIDG